MKRIYISGPISNMPNLNVEAFASAAVLLRSQGWIPVNPHEKDIHADATWVEHLRADIPLLLGCKAVYLLKGWQQSKGASLERHIAQELGMTVIEQESKHDPLRVGGLVVTQVKFVSLVQEKAHGC